MQYLDDLDDFIGILGLVVERIRRVAFTLFSYTVVAAGAVAGIAVAILHQPLALATSTLLFVTLLYRSVTSPHSAVTPKP